MDFVKKFAGGNSNEQSAQQGSAQQGSTQQGQSGGFLGGLGNKLNSAAGGGPESEKNEDYLDKGVDFVQEKFMGQGPQNNESAIEQAKDEQISDMIRKQWQSTTGSALPIKDKETKF
ncbi:hypothetical protein E4T42_05254 [Aureobasidium subglaciale]|uniref:DNA damage-responsive protein 48 n=1 Tax=Aureobasidium subglaciale (strain EXF-2481) TaxID=1043005 RepID=A0A074Y3S0_AURSE|nr:uncharacterized protein AUEXF2481DRAFT_32262 [Aureobasidium subglaciale EXF-2481]KAI5202246.1 hypothetical protein E4T38_05705 [Aureobasidium subglaciale]KAI5221092.1 hypothetical protein E4T40_05657 [Aureobasidium subglaciale]KAI5224319.1 hypothetical protein E4T41_05684 [Aureobasidium subglaciale]KAI5249594.1 hypothetical protein E4T42_05254 [Aureobasidium subglaciale]KAI5261047.1 hypothetical protein E4T46_05459 [Aureobasidium subglaciale]